MQQHIPAWKRIGLKLKYAKDSSHQDNQNRENEIAGASNGNHEIAETTDLDHVRPPKKRKLSPNSTAQQQPEDARALKTRSPTRDAVDKSIPPGQNETTNAEKAVRLSPSGALTSSALRTDYESRDETSEERDTSIGAVTGPNQQTRRKSVTFTPETKQEDGFSASLLFKQWIPGHQAGESAAISSQPDSALTPTEPEQKSVKSKRSKETHNIDPTLSEPTTETNTDSLQDDSNQASNKRNHKTAEPNRPRDKRSTNNSLSKRTKDAQAESKSVSSCLEYLQQFSTDRASWRFNKNKQKILLKNLFDVHLIPPQHNSSIVEYIAGLQGQAARQRVLESATSILRTLADQQVDIDMESMESEEARRKAYANALMRDIQRYERSKAGPNEYDEQQLADMKHEIERGQRAEAILYQALHKELYPEQYESAKTAPQPSNNRAPNGNEKREESIPTTTISSEATAHKRKKRKTRTAAVDDSSSSSSDSDSDDDTNASKGRTTLGEALRVTSDPVATARSSISTTPSATGKGKKTIFEEDFLDKMFPSTKSYHQVAPKRKRGEKDKARGFAYTHGVKDDESASESE